MTFRGLMVDGTRSLIWKDAGPNLWVWRMHGPTHWFGRMPGPQFYLEGFQGQIRALEGCQGQILLWKNVRAIAIIWKYTRAKSFFFFFFGKDAKAKSLIWKDVRAKNKLFWKDASEIFGQIIYLGGCQEQIFYIEECWARFFLCKDASFKSVIMTYDTTNSLNSMLTITVF